MSPFIRKEGEKLQIKGSALGSLHFQADSQQ